MLRILDAGESHGPALTAILDGFPAGVALSEERINNWLALRQQGYGRGNRQKIEKDTLEILSGVRHGQTLGSPIAIRVSNRDWANWESAMHPFNKPSASDESGRAKKIQRPRPGHADLVGLLKYGFDDVRNALERASARHTAVRTAVGALCYELLLQLGVTGTGFVTAVGSERASIDARELNVKDISKRIETSQLRCPDAEAEKRMIALIDKCKKEGDSIGGVFEVWFEGLVPGLGTYAHWDRRLDGRLAQAFMSIQAIKGVEIGAGFQYAASRGSESHDGIVIKNGEIGRKGNNSGGLEAGMTNGETLVVRAGMKPLPTLVKPLPSVNLKTKQAEKATVERTDVCAIGAASIVGFSVAAVVLAEAYLDKFGSDCLEDIEASVKLYRKRIEKVLSV